MSTEKQEMAESGEVHFQQAVSHGCGLDVHKKVTVATIDGAGLRRETREYQSTTSSLTELRERLLEKGVTHVAMESTGVETCLQCIVARRHDSLDSECGACQICTGS